MVSDVLCPLMHLVYSLGLTFFMQLVFLSKAPSNLCGNDDEGFIVPYWCRWRGFRRGSSSIKSSIAMVSIHWETS